MYCNLISFQLLIVHIPDFATKGNFWCTIHFTNTIANERHFVTIVCFMLWVDTMWYNSVVAWSVLFLLSDLIGVLHILFYCK